MHAQDRAVLTLHVWSCPCGTCPARVFSYREFGRYLVAHSEPNHITSRLARLRDIPVRVWMPAYRPAVCPLCMFGCCWRVGVRVCGNNSCGVYGMQHVEGTGFHVEDFMHFCFAVVENAGAIAKVMGSLKKQEGLTTGERKS